LDGSLLDFDQGFDGQLIIGWIVLIWNIVCQIGKGITN
jgi:hypothetical protein